MAPGVLAKTTGNQSNEATEKKESEKCMASRSQVFEFHFGVKVVEGKRLNVRVVRGNDIQLFIVILVFVEKIDKTAKE